MRIPKGMYVHATLKKFIPHSLTVLLSLIKYYLFYLLSLTSKAHGAIFISKLFLYLNFFEKEEGPALRPSFHYVLSHLSSEGGQGNK